MRAYGQMSMDVMESRAPVQPDATCRMNPAATAGGTRYEAAGFNLQGGYSATAASACLPAYPSAGEVEVRG